MDLMLFAWEKMAEVGLFIEEVSKAMQELQLLLSLIAEYPEFNNWNYGHFNLSLGLGKNAYFVMELSYHAGGIHAFCNLWLE